MTYEVNFTTQFKRDLKLAQKQHRNVDELFDVVEKLANDVPLEAKYRDHNLTGDYISYRECHLDPDWLLIYRKNADKLILILFRTGSHSDLF